MKIAEIWKAASVAGGEQYEVSDHGRVRNISGRLLKLTTNSNGYKVVSFARGVGAPRKQWYVHRLVAYTFIPNPLNAEVVNHRDRNRVHNSASNLEWVTQYDNVRHFHAKDVQDSLYKRFNAAIVELVGLRDAVYELGQR